jgi:hypothetical protein
MRGIADYGVATFHSTHSVIKAEKLLKDAGLASVRLVPVPSQISSDCGVTVRFLRSDIDRARIVLAELADDLEGFFLGGPEGWNPIS